MAPPLIQVGRQYLGTLASTPLQARGEQRADRKYYREVEIKEVEMVAVDDFDDILQEELFGRPVTDLDSLWCSDWASEGVGAQHWPHTTDQVPILTKKQENLTSVNALTTEATFHQEWMAPNDAYSSWKCMSQTIGCKQREPSEWNA